VPAVPRGVRGAVISGWGTALPDKIVTNDDLALTMDTSDEWIRERTGVRERRVGGSTASLSTEAGRQALEMAGVDPASIDVLVLATTTPDQTVPATSASVQHALGLRCGAFDVNAACSGFTYAMVVAHGLIGAGASRALVIGTDTLSRVTDWTDRGTAILFADGSGAVVLEAVDGPGQLLGWDIDADGSLVSLLYADVGDYIHMDGKEVFRRAVRIMVDSAEKSMKHAGSPPTRSPSWCPTRPTCASSRRPASACASPWSGLPPCCTTRATRRRRRSPSPSPTPSTTVA
jgi:3-oxoacyl-[acyl-carrier-protein] synthase-3